MYRGKNIYIYGIAAVAVLGGVSAIISETKFRKRMKRELHSFRKFQSMENDFFTRHTLQTQAELEEIRDEIGTVYGHLEEMENIRKCGR